MARRVPLVILYNLSDDNFLISKIHSRQLIIFCFRRFSLNKIILQSQQKKFYTINTASFVR